MRRTVESNVMVECRLLIPARLNRLLDETRCNNPIEPEFPISDIKILVYLHFVSESYEVRPAKSLTRFRPIPGHGIRFHREPGARGSPLMARTSLSRLIQEPSLPV